LAAVYWSRLDRVYYAATCDDAEIAGFDDRSFYDELRKPANLRSIPLQQALREEAVDVLKSWSAKVDKTPY
jgi:tRNA(Arg) A34 adenosine deaminase TadA